MLSCSNSDVDFNLSEIDHSYKKLTDAAYRLGRIAGIRAVQELNRRRQDWTIEEAKTLADSLSKYYHSIKRIKQKNEK